MKLRNFALVMMSLTILAADLSYANAGRDGGFWWGGVGIGAGPFATGSYCSQEDTECNGDYNWPYYGNYGTPFRRHMDRIDEGVRARTVPSERQKRR